MKEKLTAYLNKLDHNYPYVEREDFYARSSHSSHEYLHYRRLAELMSNETPENILLAFERLFIVGYALSAVYAEMKLTDGIVTAFWGSGHSNWFHGPFSGGFDTIRCQFKDDDRVAIGQILTHEDEVLRETYEAYSKFNEEVYHKAFKEERSPEGYSIRDPEGVRRFNEEIPNLHARLKEIFERVLAEAKSLVEKL